MLNHFILPGFLYLIYKIRVDTWPHLIDVILARLEEGSAQEHKCIQILSRNWAAMVKVQVHKMSGLTRQGYAAEHMKGIQEAQQPTSISLLLSFLIHLTTLNLFRNNYPWQQTTRVSLKSLYIFFIKRLSEYSKTRTTTG